MIHPATWTTLIEPPPEESYVRPTTPDTSGDYAPEIPDKPGDPALPIGMDIDEYEASEEGEESEDDQGYESDENLTSIHGLGTSHSSQCRVLSDRIQY